MDSKVNIDPTLANGEHEFVSGTSEELEVPLTNDSAAADLPDGFWEEVERIARARQNGEDFDDEITSQDFRVDDHPPAPSEGANTGTAGTGFWAGISDVWDGRSREAEPPAGPPAGPPESIGNGLWANASDLWDGMTRHDPLKRR